MANSTLSKTGGLEEKEVADPPRPAPVAPGSSSPPLPPNPQLPDWNIIIGSSIEYHSSRVGTQQPIPINDNENYELEIGELLEGSPVPSLPTNIDQPPPMIGQGQ